MRTEVNEATLVRERGIMIVKEIESEINTVNETGTGKGLESGVAEEAGMGEEGETGNITTTDLEEMQRGIDTMTEMGKWIRLERGVGKGAGPVPLVGMVTGGH